MAHKKDIYDWTIYKITNPKGCVYIGKTTAMLRRMQQYKASSAKGQLLLFRSINKYGFENHTIKILETFTSNILNSTEREKFWISEYKSNKSRYVDCNGLNLTDGGEGTKGRIVSDETKKRMSIVMKGKTIMTEDQKRRMDEGRRRVVKKPVSAETRMKISISNKGRKRTDETKELMKRTHVSYFLGKTRSDECKRKLSVANLGKSLSEEHKMKLSISHKGIISKKRKKVIQFSLNGEFVKEHPSFTGAAKELGVHTWTLRKHIMGDYVNCKGFIFKYA